MTFNFYAGFWLLIGLVAIQPRPRAIPLAVLIGATHGAFRGLAIARFSLRIAARGHFDIMIRRLQWRQVDGLALGVIAGVLATVVIGGS